MATNICLDCAYFLNHDKCKKASEEIRECDKYEFIRREINHNEKNDT